MKRTHTQNAKIENLRMIMHKRERESSLTRADHATPDQIRESWYDGKITIERDERLEWQLSGNSIYCNQFISKWTLAVWVLHPLQDLMVNESAYMLYTYLWFSWTCVTKVDPKRSMLTQAWFNGHMARTTQGPLVSDADRRRSMVAGWWETFRCAATVSLTVVAEPRLREGGCAAAVTTWSG